MEETRPRISDWRGRNKETMDEIKKHAVTERKTENERKREGPRRWRDEGDKGGEIGRALWRERV